jgi:hypothetical protein
MKSDSLAGHGRGWPSNVNNNTVLCCIKMPRWSFRLVRAVMFSDRSSLNDMNNAIAIVGMASNFLVTSGSTFRSREKGDEGHQVKTEEKNTPWELTGG